MSRKFGRREIAQRTMWPGIVVIVLPRVQHNSDLGEGGEQRLVQQLVAQAGVEALDEGILGGLAGSDVVPLDLDLMAPAQHRHAGQLGAVVGDAHRRPTALGDEDLKLAHDPQARQRSVRDQRQAFTGEVVDDSENAEAAAFREGIRQEVQAPALIGSLRDRTLSMSALYKIGHSSVQAASQHRRHAQSVLRGGFGAYAT